MGVVVVVVVEVVVFGVVADTGVVVEMQTPKGRVGSEHIHKFVDMGCGDLPTEDRRAV